MWVKLSLTTTIKRRKLGLLWDKPVPDCWLCFCPNFLSFCWSSLVAFGEFTFQKFVMSQLFVLDFCALWQATFYPHQDYEHVNFYKKSSVYSIGWSFRNWIIAASLQLAKVGTFQPRFYKIHFFINISNLFTMLCKNKLKTSSLCREETFNFLIRKKQRYKVFANFWRLWWRDMQFKGLCWHCHRWETSGPEHNLH